MFRVHLVALLFLPLGCGDAETFRCDDDGDCDGQEALGRCEPNGYCSFPDDSCPSTRRYGTLAGEGLASTCVPPDVADGTGSASVSDTIADDDGTQSDSQTQGTLDGPADSSEGSISDSQPDPVCGNEIAEPGEACDGSDLGATTCVTLGHDSGTVTCLADCTADASLCGDCGNGIVEAEEVCDGPIDDATCQGLGWFGGVVTCAADCLGVDESGCTNCGNALLDPGELCDAQAGLTSCESLGYGAGDIACGEDCSPDVANCGPLACGVDPELPVGACPTECSSCTVDTCTFDCIGGSQCVDAAIVCPAGWHCLVQCNGSSSCADATVACPEFYGCDVTCTGSSACAGLVQNCSLAGTCGIVCDATSSSVCDDAVVDCGADGCTAACDGEEPDVQCGPSCACSGCP